MLTFKIIAIGSSAGGLVPMTEIISFLPIPLSAAIILVPHLLRGTESNLAALIARYTKIPVVKVTQSTEVRQGYIYVLTAGKIMTVQNNILIVRERLVEEVVNQCIDIFFTSLAEDARQNAIGVILSGGGIDGVKGAGSIENHGGIVLVQQPKTAEFRFMPEFLIVNYHPNYVLTPRQIAEKLSEFTNKI